MRKIYLNMLALPILCFIFLTACQKDEELASKNLTNQEELDWRCNQNSKVYPPNAHPFGQSYEEWTENWWIWLMNFDCASSPLLDPTGANADQNQSGPVYYLVGTTGGSATRDVTIPRNKAVLFPIINTIYDYPCPDPNFQPAPGQTLEEFLQEGAAAFIDLADNLSVTLDGQNINDEEDYRFPTDLFQFTGDPDLTNCLDPCVTGSLQDAVSDGYWIMLKKLHSGSHTLHFYGEVPDYGFEVDVTYNITVP